MTRVLNVGTAMVDFGVGFVGNGFHAVPVRNDTEVIPYRVARVGFVGIELRLDPVLIF